MKVRVTKPGTVVWDAEQRVVVQDTPIAVRATGAIRDALNSKQIIEVFDEEVIIDNSTIRPEAKQELPNAKVQPAQELPNANVQPAQELPIDEAQKAKKLTTK